MLALTVFLEKLDRYVPWAPWIVGGVSRHSAAHLRRSGGVF
jgi:hypothetical protein